GLLYHPEDRDLAKTLQGILQGGGIGLDLREESVRQTERDFSDRPVLCLWTRNAASHWQALVTERATPPPGLLLRTDPSALPPADSGSADIIDLLDLGDTQSLEQAITRLKIQKLLNEIDNPNTTPQRRLEIGDQLAELGDPRHGVGVYEAQAGVEAEEQESIERYPPEIKSLLDEIENTETAPKRRLAIGDELVRLGDPRHGVGLDARGLPDIDWVEIPEGEFIYGEGKKQQTIYLEGFRISRYLITNVQYQSFIDAGGYKEERWWRDLKRPEPEKSRWEQTNRPRTNVDWYEAVAFSRWLAEQLKQPIHLPTEQEWERAARGTDGRAYPWGDEYLNGYANTKESSNKGEYLEQTTAVGLYPQGGSPDGVMDLAGTVWDWCLNKYDHPEQIEPDNSGEGRVLRGGSWIDHPENARAASRGRFVPDDRINRWGFRVVWSAPIK
ncbi:MAG: SUMF1/EgtB/PvdO family nonheme iron enzyme, partial [Candidatus Thiodiazotropha sp.]